MNLNNLISRKSIYSVITVLLVISTLNGIMYTTATGVYASVGCGDSMEPNYQSGDILVYQSSSSISEGDVVRLGSDDGPDIYHRVIEINNTRENPYYIKGDNNDFADGWYNKSRVKGVSIWQSGNVNPACKIVGLD